MTIWEYAKEQGYSPRRAIRTVFVSELVWWINYCEESAGEAFKELMRRELKRAKCEN